MHQHVLDMAEAFLSYTSQLEALVLVHLHQKYGLSLGDHEEKVMRGMRFPKDAAKCYQKLLEKGSEGITK